MPMTKIAMSGTPVYKKILLNVVPCTCPFSSNGFSDLMVRSMVSEVMGAACAAARRMGRMMRAIIRSVVMVVICGFGFTLAMSSGDGDMLVWEGHIVKYCGFEESHRESQNTM